jgi:hypothetical protein
MRNEAQANELDLSGVLSPRLFFGRGEQAGTLPLGKPLALVFF